MQRLDLSLRLLGNDIRIFIKAKGFFCFWMVEHDYNLRESPKWKKFQRCEVARNQNKLWLIRYI